MSIDTEDFNTVWGAPTYSAAAAPSRFDQFEDLVPELLLTFWREFGFSGFGNGLFWLCDPITWQPAVDAWTRDLDLEMGSDRWLAFCRSAFGRMQLWGQRTGMSLTITPYRGSVLAIDRSDSMTSSDSRDDQIYAALMGAEKRNLDVTGDDGHPLFDRVVALRGPVVPTRSTDLSLLRRWEARCGQIVSILSMPRFTCNCSMTSLHADWSTKC
nr:GAD-like domain-containing protein [Nocardia salmonicida]